MIKKEEIKKGLEFVLPYSNFKDEEDEKEYISSLVWYGFDVVRHWACMFCTKMQFDGEECTLVTTKRPIFEVVEFENDSVFVKNKNANMTDDAFIFIDLSFVEKHGEVVENPKKEEKMLEGWYEKLNGLLLDMQKVSDGLHKNCVEKSMELLNETIGSCKQKEPASRFKEITDKMFETFKAKNHDYGSSFSNLFKECGMTYAYGHMAEKLERVKSLMKDEAKVKGEGMKDSLLDLANYAILTVMEIENNENEQKE